MNPRAYAHDYKISLLQSINVDVVCNRMIEDKL